MEVAEFRANVREWLAENDLSPGPDHSLDGQVAPLWFRYRATGYAS